MTRRSRAPPPAQGSFLEVFAQAALEEEIRHLPATIEEAIPYYDTLITRYHEAVITGRHDDAGAIVDEAEQLAVRLNGGTLLGIKGDDDSPCYVLERATRSPDGIVPRYGQTGSFTITIRDCQIRVEIEGLYGICIPQYSIHAINHDKPFPSETGYRSFMSHDYGIDTTGLTVDQYVTRELQHYITTTLRNKLPSIKEQHRR